MLVRIGLRLCLLIAAPGTLAAQQPCFDGTGGPNGDFDWVVRQGNIYFFDTTSTPVIGGPDGIPTTTQICVNGLVDVRNLIIEEGGEIRVQGPNPMRIRATGDVIIRGRLELSGFNAKDVATLNTGHQTEIGGAGAAGGGRGGNANVVTTSSSPRGGRGQGPFALPEAGGGGGETGYNASFDVDLRRPGGGGGGRFAGDWIGTVSPAESSVAATAGTDGHPQSRGADPNDGHSPAQGGRPGEGPFVDGDDANDFFGLRPLRGAGGRTRLLRGELPGLWAGYGGGGGGNADPAGTFPTPSWNPSSDETAGPGGGGGGALHVQALGRIVFGRRGEILSRGGNGGTGENTNFLDHVGGTGGSGSGGHIVLETASEVDFTDGGANAGASPRDWLSAAGRPIRRGIQNYVDACCRNYSNGGAGGAGVIQIHVPEPFAPPGTDPATTDIVVPLSVAIERDRALDLVASPPAYALFPTCKSFPIQRAAWFGTSDLGLAFLRYALESTPADSPAPEWGELGLVLDRSALEVPRRF